MRPLTRLLALPLMAAAALSLQGCFGLAVTGIGATALMVDDRRTAGTYVEDENIEWKARGIMTDRFSNAHVNTTSYNLSILLTGEVPSEQMKKDVEQAVRGITGVKNVTNELSVAGNTSMTARTNDSFTTTNTKARFLNNGKFSANHVKVVTEAGTVYLMGMVTRAESDAAVELARTTSGVARVVKVFEYIESVPKG